MKRYTSHILISTIMLLVIATVASNYIEKISVDSSKLPAKVEQSKGFQRWITNLKNKDLDVSADDFRLKEQNAIYNTKWIQIDSIDEPGKREEFEKYIELHKTFEKVAFSPSERGFVDYRHEHRGDEVIGIFEPNKIHFYGLRDDKILNARIVDCSIEANCYFDRAFFLDNTNDVFAVSEFSRKIDKEMGKPQPCTHDESCEYSIKLHVIDLVNNKRRVYESKTLELILNQTIPQL